MNIDNLRIGIYCNKEIDENTISNCITKYTDIEIEDSLSDKIKQQGFLVFNVKTLEEGKKFLKELNKIPFVGEAGQVVSYNKSTIKVLTNKFKIKLKNFSENNFEKLKTRFGFYDVKKANFSNTYTVTTNESATIEEIAQILNELKNFSWIDNASSVFCQNVKLYAIEPEDYLFPMQWFSKLMELPTAWQKLSGANSPKGDITFGNPDIKVAIIDSGVESETISGVVYAKHPDLNVLLSDGTRKISEFYDFNSNHPNNNNPSNFHGTACAGVVSASHNRISLTAGTAGVAPNTKLMGIGYQNTGAEDEDIFLWSSGLSKNTSLPTVVKGADILSSSWGLSNDLDPDLAYIYTYITNYGRLGRGVLNFFSSGNSEDSPIDIYENGHLISDRVISVGASSYDDTGFNEILAPYSSKGSTVFICAPSSSAAQVPELRNPINNYFTYTTYPQEKLNKRFDFKPGVDPDAIYPATPLAKSKLTVQPTIGDTSITIDPADGGKIGFREGDSILIGNPGDFDSTVNALPTFEGFKITSVSGTNNNILHLDDQIRKFQALNKVVNGGIGLYGIFGGTSHACPALAGVAALILSVRPGLTWLEVKDILKNSADKINAGEFGSETDESVTVSGIWKDSNGDDVVDGSGILNSLSPQVFGVLTLPAFKKNRYITVEDATIFAPGQAFQIETAAVREIRIVRRIDTTLNRVYIDPLIYDHNSPEVAIIELGRFPYRSDYYGYGRVNAAKAVQLAIDYSHNDRDLIVRDYLQDNGLNITEVAVNPIQSPDIWIQHTIPDINGVPDYLKQAPHENPIMLNDRYFGVRIKNRGNKYASLNGWVRFFIALTDGTIPEGIATPFKFPDDWTGESDDSNDISNITSGTKKTYFLGQSLIAEGEIGTEAVVVKSQPWSAADRPPSNTPLKTFLLVQVAPHDGPIDGYGAEHSNNLSYREITFAETDFKKIDGSGSLPAEIELGSAFNGVQEFKIDIRSVVGTISADKIQVEIVRTALNNVEEKEIYKKIGNSWVFEGIVPDWADINIPVITDSNTAATGEQSEVTFTGNLKVTSQHKNASIKVVIYSSISAVAISEENFEMTVSISSNGSSGPGTAPAPVVNPYAFTDFEFLPDQNPSFQYGSTSSTEFRVNSLFTGIGSGATQLKAYAMTDGVAIIQEVDGQSGLVNLILKPDAQPNVNGSTVKYYVYKGLKRSSFLDSSGQVISSSAAQSDLLKRMWEIRDKLNADIADPKLDSVPPKEADGTKGPSGTQAKQPRPLKRSDLGLPEIGGTLDGTTMIDDVFDSYTFQPIISGWYLGDFETTLNYGLEILVEGPNYFHKLSDVRIYDHKITISYDPGQNQFGSNQAEDSKTKLQREQILSYVDPSAYFGLLYNHKIKLKQPIGGKATLEKDDIYSEIISKYSTKNKIYIDIRNELNNSLNFYGNYSDGSDPRKSAKVQFEDITPTLVNKEYHDSNGWPILIINTSEIPANNSIDKNKVKLALPNGDNDRPTLYLAGAVFYNEYPGEKQKFQILTPGATYTNTFELGIPNNKTTPAIIPSLLKIVHAKRYDPQNLPTPVVYPSPIPVKDDLLDNLFSPFDFNITDVANKVVYKTSEELKYIGWTSLKGIDFIVRQGVARDSIGEICFVFIQNPTETNGTSSYDQTQFSTIDLTKGTVKAASFFHFMKDDLGLIRSINDRSIKISVGNTVTISEVSEVNTYVSSVFHQPSFNNLMFFAYSDSERSTINTLRGQFLNGGSVFFCAIDREMNEDLDGYAYFTFELGIQGIKLDSGVYNIERIDTNIIFYSTDGKNYFTTLYASQLNAL